MNKERNKIYPSPRFLLPPIIRLTSFLKEREREKVEIVELLMDLTRVNEKLVNAE